MVILKHGANTWEDKRVIVEKRDGQESIRYRKPYETLYAHLSAVYVEVNQRVSRGQILGISGDTGMTFPKSPHLHFGLKELGSWVDPDFYGMNHKEMDFWNGIDNLEIEDWEVKLLNQVEIYNKIMERLNEEKRNEFIKFESYDRIKCGICATSMFF